MIILSADEWELKVWKSFFKSRGLYYAGFFQSKKNPKAFLELPENLHVETQAHMLTYVGGGPNLVWVG